MKQVIEHVKGNRKGTRRLHWNDEVAPDVNASWYSLLREELTHKEESDYKALSCLFTTYIP